MLLTGTQVKALRRAALLSIRKAAQIYGTTMYQWKLWESGDAPIPTDVFQMLEEAAEVEPLDLIFDEYTDY
jgi:DNA-binding transcriptional regulator YiaG